MLLLQQHVWTQTRLAFQALWNGRSWDVIELVGSAGLPFPKFLALVAALVALLVVVGWLLGFLTRLVAAVFLPVTLGALLVCNRAGNSAGAEISLLYFFTSIAVMFSGPAWFSLDALFRRRRPGSSGKLRYNL